MNVNNYHEIMSCEVCGNETLESVLDLGFHPMCDDLVVIDDSRVCNEYPIEILFCRHCDFFVDIIKCLATHILLSIRVDIYLISLPIFIPYVYYKYR